MPPMPIGSVVMAYAIKKKKDISNDKKND